MDLAGQISPRSFGDFAPSRTARSRQRRGPHCSFHAPRASLMEEDEDLPPGRREPPRQTAVTGASLLGRTSPSSPGNGNASMLKKPNCRVIAIEEHYWDEELAKTFSGVESTRRDEQLKRLYDLGD